MATPVSSVDCINVRALENGDIRIVDTRGTGTIFAELTPREAALLSERLSLLAYPAVAKAGAAAQ